MVAGYLNFKHLEDVHPQSEKVFMHNFTHILIYNSHTTLKACFLFVLFALNSIAGFACAVGAGLGSNSGHHRHEVVVAEMHIHKDGKEHVHHGANQNENPEKIDYKDHGENEKDNSTTAENCCKDKVIKFYQLDKKIPGTIAVPPVFETAFTHIFFYYNLASHTNVVKDVKKFVRSYHPPIPDIRTAIQSFQI